MELISKTQVRKIGDKIRKDNSNVSEETLIGLQKYRTSFKNTLSDIFTDITQESKRVFTDSITSYRIKRIDSIIRKLSRIDKMELDRMWDIAGCRCIFKNEKHINKLKKYIEKKYYIIETQTRNYYSNPSETGYKSLHLYIRKSKDDPFTIEVQLRRVNDHNWATLVEITDLLFEDCAKEATNIYDTKFGRFHFLLSKKEDRTTKEKMEIIEFANNSNLYNKLSSIFIKNYVDVRSQWEVSSSHKRNSYFIIESQKDTPPIITSYENYEKAEDEYFKRFLQNNKSNILLTHLSNTSFNQISIAYSNYILTMHTFLDDFISLMEEMIIFSVKELKIKSFKKYYSVYLQTMVTHNNELLAENAELNRISAGNSKKSMCKNWKEELNKRYNQIINNQRNFIKNVGHVYPKNPIYSYLFRTAINSINKKYLT